MAAAGLTRDCSHVLQKRLNLPQMRETCSAREHMQSTDGITKAGKALFLDWCMSEIFCRSSLQLLVMGEMNNLLVYLQGSGLWRTLLPGKGWRGFSQRAISRDALVPGRIIRPTHLESSNGHSSTGSSLIRSMFEPEKTRELELVPASQINSLINFEGPPQPAITLLAAIA